MLGTAIKEARELKRITQCNLASKSYLSPKTISAIETGRRNITEEHLKILCKELNDPRLYLEAANEICDGVFSVHWLDGESADLHRASVKEKIIEELSEAVRAINLAKVYKNPQSCTEIDVEMVRKSVEETIDVYNAAAIYIAVMCREYNLPIKELFKNQKQKLISRKYIKG